MGSEGYTTPPRTRPGFRSIQGFLVIMFFSADIKNDDGHFAVFLDDCGFSWGRARLHEPLMRLMRVPFLQGEMLKVRFSTQVSQGFLSCTV